MRYENNIIPEPRRYTKETILEEKKYKFRTLALGKDRYQYMVGVKCSKKGCVHPKSERGFTVHWRKFFAEVPPASEYGGSYRLAKAYFDDPEELGKEFGELRLGCS